MIHKDVKIGGKYYYNNGQVEIIKKEVEPFLLVKGIKDIHTELNGSNFCTPCQVGSGDGSHPSHQCGDAQEVIDEVVDDLSEEDIFWVNARHLQGKPFEYKKWEKITEENNNLLKEIKLRKNERDEINLSIKNKLEDCNKLTEEIDCKQNKLTEIALSLDSAEKQQIVLENVPDIKITNSNLKIRTSDVLNLLKRSLTLQYLEDSGVDNWEWYSESMPKCEDVDDFLENEALQELSNFIKE